MPQLTHSQPPTVRVRPRGRRLLAAAADIAGVATSAFLVISERDKAPPAPGGAVSDSPSAGVRHDGGHYRALGRRATLSHNRSAATRYDGGPEEGTRGVAPARQPRIRYDGGPEEGTAATFQRSAPATPDPNSITSPRGVRYDGGPDEGTRGPLAAPRLPSTRYDGGPEEGTRGALSSDAPSHALPAKRYHGGPEEGTRGRGH
jgi:hypothetical protein